MSFADLFKSSRSKFLDRLLFAIRLAGGLTSSHMDRIQSIPKGIWWSAPQNVFIMDPLDSIGWAANAHMATYETVGFSGGDTVFEVWGNTGQVALMFFHRALSKIDFRSEFELKLRQTSDPILPETAFPCQESIEFSFGRGESTLRPLSECTLKRVFADSRAQYPQEFHEFLQFSTCAKFEDFELFGSVYSRIMMIGDHFGWTIGDAPESNSIVCKAGTVAPEIYLVDHEEYDHIFAGHNFSELKETIKREFSA